MFYSEHSQNTLFAFISTRNFKQTLIELERLYDLLIEVEDCEKKLTALPTGTSMRVQVMRVKFGCLARPRDWGKT